MPTFDLSALSRNEAPAAPVARSFHDSDCASDRRCITVCHPVWQLARGGLEQQLVAAISGLPEDEFRHVLVVCNDNTIADEFDFSIPKNTKLIRHPVGRHQTDWATGLAATLSSLQVDVVHVRGLSMLVDALRAVELVGDVSLGMSFHGFEEFPPRMNFLRRSVLRAAIERCDERWAVSRGAADGVCSYLSVNRASFDVIANGVDVERFMPATDAIEAKTTLGISTDHPVILCVGNIKPIKGHAILLEAALQLSRRGHSFTLICVGEDYCEGQLHRHATAIGGDNDVLFVGPREDVRPWLHAADIYVQPSLWEGMPNSLLEAMACGLPVVATSAGGTLELIQDGTTGLLVPPGDEKELADALHCLMIDEHLRSTLGRVARAHAVRNLSLAHSHALLARKYEKLAQRKWSREA